MTVYAIAAVGKNYELGRKNELIWRSKADLAHFKEETMGKFVVVGRKTYESMPTLKGRKVICLSRRGVKLKQDADHWISPAKGSDPWSAIKAIVGESDVVIAGGTEIYKLFADRVEQLLLTRFDAEEPKADAYFPADAYQALLYGEGELLLDREGVTRYTRVKPDTAPYELIGEVLVISDNKGGRRTALIAGAIAGFSHSAFTRGNKHITLMLKNGDTEVIYFKAQSAMEEAFDELVNWLADPHGQAVEYRYEPSLLLENELH